MVNWVNLVGLSDLVGFGRIWSDSVGLGRTRSDNLVGFGRIIWSDYLVGFGRIWSDLVGLGRIGSDWSNSVVFGRIWSDSVGVAPGRGPLRLISVSIPHPEKGMFGVIQKALSLRKIEILMVCLS